VNQQRGELAQRRDELNQRMGDAQRGLADAQAQQQQVHQQMADKEKDLPGPAPTSVKSALKQLAAARQQVDVAAVAEPEEAVEARYGNPKNPLTSSIDRVLQSGEAAGCGWRCVCVLRAMAGDRWASQR
jgi:chromosome segregation ATPase